MSLDWIIGIILAGIVVISAVGLFVIVHIIPQGQAHVIYSFRQFSRIAGPGWAIIVPLLDVIERTIDVRDHPLEVNVPGVFAFRAPSDWTLNLWCRFDPKTVAEGDKHKMAQFVQISESERRQQFEVKIRDALVRQVAVIEGQMPLPDRATLMDGVAALVPGSKRFNALLEALKNDLQTTLPSLGMVLNTVHPIVVTKRNLSDEIVGAIKRRQGREIDSQWLANYADELRQRFPELSNAILAQIVSSIKGVDGGNIQQLLLQQTEGGRSEVEVQLSNQGKASANIVTQPKVKQAAPVNPRRLTKNDLSVLKRIPRDEQKQLSA